MRDLRISVTDRCNFRCVYCMPREVFDADYQFLPHGAILSFEEIARLARVFVGLGVREDPPHRRRAAGAARPAPPGRDARGARRRTYADHQRLAARKAGAARCKAAGLDRVTVSLDSLDDATFRAMNDADFPVAKVLEGIDAAAAAGLAPVKINMVVKRGVNDQDIVRMARALARHRPHRALHRVHGRRLAPTAGAWTTSCPRPRSCGASRRAGRSSRSTPNYAGEVAERWRYVDGAGEIGVISSVTQAFCSSCNRMRLSTEGSLYTCLFAQSGHDLKSLLRGGATRRGARATRSPPSGSARDDRYSEIRTAETAKQRKVEMSYIGG